MKQSAEVSSEPGGNQFNREDFSEADLKLNRGSKDFLLTPAFVFQQTWGTDLAPKSARERGEPESALEGEWVCRAGLGGPVLFSS